MGTPKVIKSNLEGGTEGGTHVCSRRDTQGDALMASAKVILSKIEGEGTQGDGIYLEKKCEKNKLSVT